MNECDVTNGANGTVVWPNATESQNVSDLFPAHLHGLPDAPPGWRRAAGHNVHCIASASDVAGTFTCNPSNPATCESQAASLEACTQRCDNRAICIGIQYGFQSDGVTRQCVIMKNKCCDIGYNFCCGNNAYYVPDQTATFWSRYATRTPVAMVSTDTSTNCP